MRTRAEAQLSDTDPLSAQIGRAFAAGAAVAWVLAIAVLAQVPSSGRLVAPVLCPLAVEGGSYARSQVYRVSSTLRSDAGDQELACLDEGGTSVAVVADYWVVLSLLLLYLLPCSLGWFFVIRWKAKRHKMKAESRYPLLG